MQEELADLQTRIAFQEQAIEELNSVVIRQQRVIEQAEKELARFRERLLAVEERLAEGGGGEQDERPPHY